MPARILDIRFSIPPELDGARLDKAVATVAVTVSRAQAKAAIIAGDVDVEGLMVSDPRHAVATGQVIQASVEESVPAVTVRPTQMELSVVAESESFIVIDKPAGMVVHPAPGHKYDTLANAVAAYCDKAASLPRAGVVHRLDKDTSGLLAIARTNEARHSFVQQFRDRVTERSYLAIVHGTPPATGSIDRPIGRDRANRFKMAVVDSGRPALTRFQLVSSSSGLSLMRCHLSSGRTHQIRVHLEHAGHPVAGDKQYRRHAKNVGDLFPRQMLHAHTLGFDDPEDGTRRNFVSDVPEDFRKAMEDVGLAAD